MFYYYRVHKEYIMRNRLTRLEKKILESIRDYYGKFSEMPTVRETGKLVGIESPGTVGRYIKSLIHKGYLRREKRIWRGLELVASEDKNSLPLMGKIAAGKPIEAIMGDNQLDPNALLLGDNRYALKVIGDSMVEAGIHNEDWVIIHSQNNAENGQIAVVLIDQEETTLKYLHHHEDGCIELRPANRTLKPKMYKSKRITIQGILVGQMRTY